MSFFGGLASGLEGGLTLGQSIRAGRDERDRRRRIGDLSPGILAGDQSAINEYAKIVGPNNALATSQGVLAMHANKRAVQMKGIAAGLAYFHDANSQQEWEQRKAMFEKQFPGLIPSEQLTFENKDRLMNMAMSYTRDMAPWEMQQAKDVAAQARVQLDEMKAGMAATANAQIGAARGLLPDEPYRQPAGTTPPFNPAVSQDRNAPRGIRNNNPGNITAGGFTERRGATGDDGRFARFETPQEGIRAVGDLLDVYERKHGLDTVQGIINRWAPPQENNTGAYVSQVARSLGVSPNEKLDLSDPRVKSGLVSAIIQHENGQNPYPPEMIEAALSGRSMGAERARDAVVANNPALAPYAPQGAISEDQAALLRPPQVTDEEFAQRARRVEALGIDPQSPQGQEYLLTGKLPDAASRKPYTDLGKLNADHENKLLTDEQYLEEYGRLKAGGGGKTTDTQRKVEMFRQRGVAALDRMRSMIDGGYKGMSMVEQSVGSDYLLDEEDQLWNQALRSAVEAMLRLDSGATVTEADIRSKMDLYEWRYADTEAVKRQKWQQLQDDFESARIAAGNAAAPETAGGGLDDMTDEELIEALEAANG